MENYKMALRLCLCWCALVLAGCTTIRSEIRHHTGGDTEVVDPSGFQVEPGDLAIVQVGVLAEDCSAMREGMTVLVREGVIVEVGQEIALPVGCRVVDGTGKYLVPGLVDAHVHLDRSPNDLLLYLANGVTGVAEMFGSKRHLDWRESIRHGALGPDLYVATVKIGSSKGLVPKVKSWYGARKNYTRPGQARRAIRRFKRAGYDAVKLSSFLELEIYEALVEEAVRQGIPAIGHLSPQVGLERLFSSGQSQLSHVEELVKNSIAEFGGMNSGNAEEYLDHLRETCDTIARRVRESGIVVATTVWLMESLPRQQFEVGEFLPEIELAYANPGLVEGSRLARGWLPGNNSYENPEVNRDPELKAAWKVYLEAFVEAIHVMGEALVRNGVILLAGTDANGTGTVPGFSLHDEFESLQGIGMDNAAILRSATVAPAEWMGTATGKVQAGYRANLLLLNENPLVDIRNTRSIEAVLVQGKYLDRATLDGMLNAVKDANERSREVAVDEWLK